MYRPYFFKAVNLRGEVCLQQPWINWLWQPNKETNRLQLKLSDTIVFPTELKTEQLNADCRQDTAFTAQDAELFIGYRDMLGKTDLNEQGQFTVAVNATASSSYMTPVAAKSWLFRQVECQFPKRVGDKVLLSTQDDGNYLVLETDEQSSLVILLSQQHYLNPARTLSQGQVIRVHNDRIKRYE